MGGEWTMGEECSMFLLLTIGGGANGLNVDLTEVGVIAKLAGLGGAHDAAAGTAGALTHGEEVCRLVRDEVVNTGVAVRLESADLDVIRLEEVAIVARVHTDSVGGHGEIAIPTSL